MSVSSSAFSDLGGKFEGSGHGWSENRWGSFLVSGSGTISFSIGYTLSTMLYESLSRPWDLAISDAEAGLLLKNMTLGTEDRKSDFLWYPDWADPLNGEEGRSGTLTAALHFNDGDSGFMSAAVSSGVGASSVPVPPAFLLLASGLVSLLGLREKTTLPQ